MWSRSEIIPVLKQYIAASDEERSRIEEEIKEAGYEIIPDFTDEEGRPCLRPHSGIPRSWGRLVTVDDEKMGLPN